MQDRGVFPSAARVAGHVKELERSANGRSRGESYNTPDVGDIHLTLDYTGP